MKTQIELKEARTTNGTTSITVKSLIFWRGFDFLVGVMIARIKPANMKIFKGFSVTTLPKT
jgi:hypothetical protein